LGVRIFDFSKKSANPLWYKELADFHILGRLPVLLFYMETGSFSGVYIVNDSDNPLTAGEIEQTAISG
jgi:hypothetical protein